MKSHHRLILTAALALTAAMSAGVAMMPLTHQDKPPAQPPAQPPAHEMPPMPPAPGEHHKWLQQLVGNWNVESEMMMGPDTPPVKSTATDTVRSLDGRWIIGEMTGQMPAAMGGGKVTAVITLGYDAEKGKYQGTWIDSMHDLLWVYTGTLDATGKILTLEAEGPNMMDPADKARVKYRDVIEIKSADHRTLTSSGFMDGKWVRFGVTNYRRTK